MFQASTRHGVVRGKAKIDSGADLTVLRFDLAYKLGLDVATAKDAAVSTASGSRMIGFELPIELRVGERSGKVRAFVPVYRVDPANQFRRVKANNLVGSDFMQTTKANLNYARSHRRVFAGAPERWPPDWKRVQMTAAERYTLRAVKGCRLPRRKK